MQADVGFELELVAVCTALKNTDLLGLWVSIREQQKLFVQKPEHKPDNETFDLNHISTFRAAEAPSNRPIAATLMSHKQILILQKPQTGLHQRSENNVQNALR